MPITPTKADRFSFGLWTIGYNGTDPFGGPTRPALDVVHGVEKLATTTICSPSARPMPSARSRSTA